MRKIWKREKERAVLRINTASTSTGTVSPTKNTGTATTTSLNTATTIAPPRRSSVAVLSTKSSTSISPQPSTTQDNNNTSDTDSIVHHSNSVANSEQQQEKLGPIVSRVSSIIPEHQQLQQHIKHFTSLIKPEYDLTSIKTAWVNVVINNPAIATGNTSDINQARLFRAELRGSLLYLSKPNQNIKSFKLDDPKEQQQQQQQEEEDTGTGEPKNKLMLSLNGSTSSITLSGPLTAPGNLSMFDAGTKNYSITHYTNSIHPNLQYDETTHTFKNFKLSLDFIPPNNVNSIEAILHYILIYPSEDDKVTIFIQLLPILPDFGTILTLLANMLMAIFECKYGEVNIIQVTNRTLLLLNNIDENFLGYLLKSDVAPYILRIIEILSENLDQEQLTNVDKFKQKMLNQQHKLIELVSNINITTSSSINADTFITLNVMEFAKFVSEIDLKFYSVWNPTLDKSLLIKQQLDTFYKKNPLVFNDTHIHYLSRLLIQHLLVETSDFEFKARVLEKWIDLACLLDKLGDMNSWLGISSIIMSQPILRLTQIWNFVSLDYIKLVRNDWSPVLFELDKNNLNESNEQHVIASRGLGKIYRKENIVAYFGDLNVEQTLDMEQLQNQWIKVHYSLSRWHEYLGNVDNMDDVLQYNEQILYKYDNMGFIFSNESLNQVLYLGGEEPITSVESKINNRKSMNPELKLILMKLIESNSNESMNLSQIMKLSLKLEPNLNECYIQETSKNTSTNSLNSIDSIEDSSIRLPCFNNNYFKLNIEPETEGELVIDEDLVFTEIGTISDQPKLGIEDDIDMHINTDESINKYIPKFATIDKLLDLLVCEGCWFNETVKIDLPEYRFIFLLNYQGFITTNGLLEKLNYRFKHCENVVIGLREGQVNWETTITDNITSNEYSKIMTIQINIIKTLILIINNFYHENFTTDLNNRTTFTSFLKLINSTIVSYYTNSITTDQFDNLIMYYKKLKSIYVKKSYRPIEPQKFDVYLSHEFKFNNSLHDVPMNRNLPGHTNVHKIEKFLIKFNKFLSGFYKGITVEDWMKVFRILEAMYYNNELLNFNLQKPNTPDEQLIISNIFNYLSTLNDNNTLILEKLPMVFQKLFKLYIKFKTYLMIQLCNNITNEERLDRMKCLLIMIKISHMKRKKFELQGFNCAIPSFIETAITNVIYSPISRSFANLWIEAAKQLNPNRPTNYDEITSLFPRLEISELNNDESLLPCFGWIIENLLEVNKISSFKNHTINFNKRYLVFKLIKQLTIEDFEISKHDSREFDFLLRLDENLPFENDNFISGRLFRLTIRDQKRILMVDNQKKLLKQKPTPPGPIHSVAKKQSTNSLKRQSLKSNKFKLSGLFNRARPLLSSEQRVVSIKDLPSTDNCQFKKSIVIPLRNRKIFPIYHMRQCFKIESDVSNDSYLFQAVSEDDVNDWLIKLDYANRHWFMSKSINVMTKNMTFGIPLNYHGECPSILLTLFNIIEARVDEVGIYRISCSTSELLNRKAYIDKNGTVEKNIDTHTATSLVKAYFRELPDSIFTDEVINLLFEIRTNITGEKLINILGKLPRVNYNTLKVLMNHLKTICDKESVNKMTSSNLATVIAPALTEASHLPVLVNNFGFMNKIVDYMIDSYKEVFDEDIKYVELSYYS